jgi:hypothetical protein
LVGVRKQGLNPEECGSGANSVAAGVAVMCKVFDVS